MLSTSKEFRKQAGKRRTFYVTANCTLSDGTTVPIEKNDLYLSGNGIVDSSDSAEFPLGLAIEKTATLSLVNDTDKFSGYNFNRAKFVLYLNLELPSGRIETLKKGSFIVSKKPSTGNRISLTLLDHMYLADKKYDSRLTFPATAGEVLRDCCQRCGIALGDATFLNSDYMVMERPENTTYRAVIGSCAMLAGGNARVDHDDLLRIITFDKDTQDIILDGGLFSPWTKGDVTNGGTFRPWTKGSPLDGGYFGDRDGLYVFSAINNLTYDTDDIEVTGIKAVIDETEYMYGSDGYVLTIQNPLIKGNIEGALQMIGGQIVGLTMRPFSLQNIADPTIEFMDPCIFSDMKGNLYFSYITNVDFLFNGYTKASNTTKSLEENAAEFFLGNAVVVEQAKKEAEKLLSGYDIGVRYMNELAANTLGYHYTERNGENGSIIAYRHDKPELSESKIVYKKGIDGFFVTKEYTGDDTTTKWSSGFDYNGDAVLNILYAIGIQAEWINTRGFTAKDNAGNITFRVNASTGEVEIDAAKFSLTGKTISDIAQSAADTKNKTFTSTPTIPYHIGDLWMDSNKSETKVCIKSRISGVFVSSDWEKRDSYIDKATADKAAADAVKAQTQEDILNRLTNGGADKGIFLADYDNDGKQELYISFNAARGGTLTLGGKDNGNGAMTILNGDGSQIGRWDKDGFQTTGKQFAVTSEGEVYSNNPIFAGALYMAGTVAHTLSVPSAERAKAKVMQLGYQTSSGETHGKYTLRIGNVSNESNATTWVVENLELCNPTKVQDTLTVGSLPARTSGSTLTGTTSMALGVLSSSSERYKDIDKAMQHGEVDAIYDITPVWAKYKDGYLSEEDERNGIYFPMLIAEDVEANIPLAANHNGDGSVEDWNQRVIIPYMIQALKEQRAEIDTLKSCINK